MSSLIDSTQAAHLESIMDDLWDTFPKSVTIVRRPIIQAQNENATFIVGYGPTSNEANFSYTPQSKAFTCLRVTKNLDGQQNSVTDKAASVENILIKVKPDAQEYILGEPVEYAVFEGKKYNIISLDQPNFFLGKTYYYFKLELTT